MSKLTQGNKFTVNDIRDSLSDGWNLFRMAPGASIAYALIFAVIGFFLLAGIGIMGVSPMALPFAGGFMLVGPILLSGFFSIFDRAKSNKPVSAVAAVSAIKNVPMQLWTISLICTMLFLIWITDAVVLYAFMVGTKHMPYSLPWIIELSRNVLIFEFVGSIMGSILAFFIFSISVFAVPLLYQNRTNLVTAIALSVRAVFRSIISSIIWGFLLSVIMVSSILLLPLFIITFPVLAFTSYSLYYKVFPEV